MVRPERRVLLASEDDQGCPLTLVQHFRISRRRAVPSQSPLANINETSCVTAISEQGGKEKTQHDNDEWLCSTGGSNHGSVEFDLG